MTLKKLVSQVLVLSAVTGLATVALPSHEAHAKKNGKCHCSKKKGCDCKKKGKDCHCNDEKAEEAAPAGEAKKAE